jgi:hypothetical protein
VLVSSNRDRAAINRSSIAAAAAGGATVWRLPCVLTRARGAAVGLSDAVRNVVYAMPDSKDTSHLAPTLDLYIGMPVMVTHNICMQLGLANGAVGRVVAFPEPQFDVKVVTDDKGSQFIVRQATSLPPFVLVQLEREPSAHFRPDLAPRIVPVTLKTDSMQVKIGDHQHSLSIQQLPIVPYHSSTYHKAQGLSCDKLCLWHVPTDGDPLMLYVGLSRVRTLAGLYLRELLTIAAARRAKPPVELLRELSRLQQLQPVELRPDPDVLARQIAATTTKEKRVVGEAAQPSSKKSRVRSEV